MEHLHKNTELFFDDFTAPVLDRSKWNVEITGEIHNHEQQAYVDAPETIYLEKGDDSANGVLVIQPRYAKGYLTPQGRVFDLLSGRINTRSKFEFNRACVSARMRIPAGAGLWPAFWALGASAPWPACGEIDIMENVGEPDWVSVAIHGPGYSGEGALVNKKYFSAPQDVTQWHEYSFHCLEDCFVFEIDNELVYRVTRPLVDFVGKWAFDSSKFIILNFALGGIYPFKTNGVRTPYYGLPESTVASIQNNEIKLQVDWVQATQP
ncbi:MAG: glycoside hydrolase family 16 protein [Chloroflexi bacterium]|nr:glycoside hydrolase family 16 protein [Chloroflexota bacterium]